MSSSFLPPIWVNSLSVKLPHLLLAFPFSSFQEPSNSVVRDKFRASFGNSCPSDPFVLLLLSNRLRRWGPSSNPRVTMPAAEAVVAPQMPEQVEAELRDDLANLKPEEAAVLTSYSGGSARP